MTDTATAPTDRPTMDIIKVLRLRTMLQTIRNEVRDLNAKATSLRRLAVVHNEIESQLASALPDFEAELAEFSSCCHDNPSPSKPEIRIAQAQLLGWIEGLLQGVQLTVANASDEPPELATAEPVTAEPGERQASYNPNSYL